jgi:hypothetical protein
MWELPFPDNLEISPPGSMQRDGNHTPRFFRRFFCATNGVGRSIAQSLDNQMLDEGNRR